MILYTNLFETKLPPIEEITNGDNMVSLYRVAFKYQLNSLFKYGYNRAFTGSKGGNMYGPGVYCTFRLEDSIYNVKTKPEYGDCIVQMKLVDGFNNFIIFDEKLAKQVYGENWHIKQQLMFVGFNENDAEILTNKCHRAVAGDMYHGRTAPAAHFLWLELRKGLYKKYNVRGFIYKGNRDGRCALPFDFSAVIPYSVSFDQGKTFKKMFNNNLYDFLKNHIDVEFRFGGKYHKAFDSVNGFTIVENNGKYNIVHNDTDQLLSDRWFDSVTGQINTRNGVFGFTCDGIQLYGSINTPEDSDGIGCILDDEYEPYCGFDVLDDLITDIKNHGTNNFSEYLEMTENEDEIQMENKRKLSNLIKECVKEVLFEERSVSEDGIVTIDNFDDVKKLLIKPENQDDVWFVQIIKRKKDNHHVIFNDEYIKSYYINTPEELESKRNEITTICKATNSRAYILPNKRSMVKITDYANNVLKPRFKKHHNVRHMGHELEIAAGQSKDWNERKLCFLDIDSDDINIYNRIISILKEYNIEPIFEYRTVNNGWHILLPDKEKVKNIDFSIIDNGNKFGRLSTVGLEIDKKLLLYACLKPNGYGRQQRAQKHIERKI